MPQINFMTFFFFLISFMMVYFLCLFTLISDTLGLSEE